MAMSLQISEILKKLETLKTPKEKVEWLQKNDSPTLRLILTHGFNPNVAYNLPEGDPPFKQNKGEIDQTESSLFSESRKLAYLWLVPSDSALENLTASQKEQLGQAEQIQAERGAALQAVLTECNEIKDRIAQAMDEITAAQAKLRAVQAEVGPARERFNVANQAATQADQWVERMRAEMERVTNELSGRQGAPAKAPNIPKYRLEMLFIQLLESLHPDEAKVLLAAKNKTLADKYAITEAIVKKAFPGMLP